MPLRRHMQAFWWFMEGRIAGMGRPGFNRCHWSDLALEEALLLSWLGKQATSTPTLSSLWAYLDQYGPKVAPFYDLSSGTIQDHLHPLRTPVPLLATLNTLNDKTRIFQDIDWIETAAQPRLRLRRDMQQLQNEIDLLKQHGISVLISLIEQPFDHPLLKQHFTVHHLPIEDVSPPTHDQVYALAQTLNTAFLDGHNIAIHCLAGLGRTTTMLMAAHLVQGYPLYDLITWVRQQNPHFLFLGSQAAFVYELADHLKTGRLSVLQPTVR